MSDQDISQCVTDHQGGEVEVIHGPFELCGAPAWEARVFLEDEEEYAVRYVVEAGNGALRYLDGFQALCSWATRHCKTTV